MSVITPTQQELKILESLREHRRKHREEYPQQAKLHADAPSQQTLGQKISDQVAKAVGSWKFIIGQSICIVGWISYNSLNNASWDPYPFILLNLILSFQAWWQLAEVELRLHQGCRHQHHCFSDELLQPL